MKTARTVLLAALVALISLGCEVAPERRNRCVTAKWASVDRRFRSTVVIRADESRESDAIVSVPGDFNRDLAALGICGKFSPDSIRVFECDPDSGELLPNQDRKMGLPVSLANGRLLWQMRASRRNARAFHIYYDLVGRNYQPPPPLKNADFCGDYATERYGDAWDFEEGDFEGITNWGNKPECIPSRKVVDGKLVLNVRGDAYFIWGKMWYEVRPTDRTESIDLNKYPILEIRARQDVEKAKWELYARPALSSRLWHYEFTVRGGDWRTIRIDLKKQARWRGKLIAFRIDPAQVESGAHVEIDYVRLSNRIFARRLPTVVSGLNSAPPKHITISLLNCRPIAGTEQPLAITALDEKGRPVANLDIGARIINANGAQLRAGKTGTVAISPTFRHGLTDESGSVGMVLTAPTRAGVDVRVECFAMAGGSPHRSVAIKAVHAQPKKYLVTPERVKFLLEGKSRLTVTAQLADEFGNPVPTEGVEVEWIATEGVTLEGKKSRTDSSGKVSVLVSFEPSVRSVYTIRCRDAQGREGKSAEIVFYRAKPRRNPIRLLPNGYFAYADGKQFLPLGGFYLNRVYYGENFSEMKSFVEATEREIEDFMRYLGNLRITAARFMLRAHRPNGMEPMDIVGKVNPSLFAKFQRYMEFARPYNIKFLLVIHEDYTKPVYFNRNHLERFALPYWRRVNPLFLPRYQARFIRERRLLDYISEKYTDPDVIACQKKYMRELIPLLRGNENVFAYELENEMVNCPASWVNEMIREIRRLDSVTPICVSHGGGGLFTADPLWWFKNTNIDFYTYHLYPHGKVTSPEIDYGAAVDILTRYGRMCGAAFLGESVGDEFRYYATPNERHIFARDIIWFSMLNGNPGCFFWNLRKDEAGEFRLAVEILSNIDFTQFRRAKPAIAVDVSHPLEDDKFFRSDEGLRMYNIMGKYVRESLESGVDFDFAVEPKGYEIVLPADEKQPLPPVDAPFRVKPPYQVKYLMRADMREALVYLRNIGSIKPWNAGRFGTEYLRRRTKGELDLRFSLPCRRLTATIWNLDTGEQQERSLSGAGRISLGETEHDFVVLFRAQ